MNTKAVFILLLAVLVNALVPGAGPVHGTDTDHESSGHSSHNAVLKDPVRTDADHSGHTDMKHDAMDSKGHDHEKMVMETKMPAKELAAKVRVEEHLGEFIDFSTRFRDENNTEVDLDTVFDKPVVLLPIFFTCPSVCNILQAELTGVLNRIDDIPGKDFNVVTLSFSDDEDASHARTSKQNYSNLIQRDMNMARWFYLVGDRENILKLTSSLGFYFVKQGKNAYIHPNVLIVLAKNGKIIRYLYGPQFLAFDVGMALSEARKGEPGISIKRGVLSFCFDYDPENKTYVFRMFRITGTAILILLIGFLLFLIRPSRSKRRRGRQHK